MDTKEIINSITKAFEDNAEAIIKNIDAVSRLNAGYNNIPSEYLKTQRDLIALSKQQELAQKQLSDSIIRGAKEAKAKEMQERSEIATKKAKISLSNAENRETEKETRLSKALTSVYLQKSKALNSMIEEYRDLAVQKQDGIALTAKETQRYDDLVKSIGKADKALKSVDELAGRHGRSVGDYAKGYDALSGSISQLAREAPAFAVSAQTGFLGISNNLPIFFDAVKGFTEKNKALKEEGKESKSAIEGIGEAIGSTSVLLSVGVTLLTVYGADIVKFATSIWKGTDALSGTKQAVEDLNGALAQGSKDGIKEVASLDVLYRTATNVALSTDQRTTATKKLLELYPLSFKNMSIEEVMMGNAVNNYNKLRQSIMDVAKVKAISEKLEERALGRVEKEIEVREKLAEANATVAKRELEYAKLTKKDLDYYNNAKSSGRGKVVSGDNAEEVASIMKVSLAKSLINQAKIDANAYRGQFKKSLTDGLKEDSILLDMSASLEKRSATHIQETTDLNGSKKTGSSASKGKSERDAEFEFNKEVLKDKIELARKIKESDKTGFEFREMYYSIEIQKLTELANLEHSHAVKRAIESKGKERIVGLKKANYELEKQLGIIKGIQIVEQNALVMESIVAPSKNKKSGGLTNEIEAEEKENISNVKKRDVELLNMMKQFNDYSKKLKVQNVKDIKELNDILLSNDSENSKALALVRLRDLEDAEKFVAKMEHLKDRLLLKGSLKENGDPKALLSKFGLSDISDMFLKLDKEGNSLFDNLSNGAETFTEKLAVALLGIQTLATAGINLMQKDSDARYADSIKTMDLQKEHELKKAGDNATAKARIEERYEKKRRKLDHDKAIRDRDYAMQKAILNTAVGVTSALASYDYVSAVLFGVLGAIEISQIANTKIPAYKDGTGNSSHKGGVALINDGIGANYTETVVTPDGNATQYSGRNVVLDMERGTKVYNHNQWEAMNREPYSVSYTQQSKKEVVSAGISKSDLQQVMESTLGKMSVNKINIDENGIHKYVKTEYSSNEIMNRRTSFTGLNL